MISKLVDGLKDQTAVSNRAAGSVAIRARESASTRAKGRFRQLKEVHGLEIVTFLAAAEQPYLREKKLFGGTVPPGKKIIWRYRTSGEKNYLEVPYLHEKKLFGGTPTKMFSDFLRVPRHF